MKRLRRERGRTGVRPMVEAVYAPWRAALLLRLARQHRIGCGADGLAGDLHGADGHVGRYANARGGDADHGTAPEEGDECACEGDAGEGEGTAAHAADSRARAA